MADNLYYADALAWSEQQADYLRRLASGEQINSLVDWDNVIEEVQDVGVSQLRACESLLRQALIHLLKLQAWPDNPAASHWRGETVGFLADAENAYAPSMLQRIDMERLYQAALRQVRAGLDEASDRPLFPKACPLQLVDLITPDPDVAGLVKRIGVSAAQGRG